MPKRVAEVGEGNEDNHGVYGFIRDLIVEGKDARFVNKRGRYVIRWSKALDRYVDFKSKKNPHFKSKKFNRRKASNGLRAALLNFYKKEGAWEYKESKKVNEKDEVVERQFQMPPRVFESLFKNVKLADDSEPDEQDTGSIKSEGESEAQSPSHSSTSDAGFDETMDMTIEGTSGIEADTDDSTNIPDNPSLNVVKTEEDGDVFLPDTIRPSEMFDTSAVDSALEEICSDGISDDISDDLDLLGVVQDICPMSGSVKGGYQFYISLTEQLPDDVTTGIVQFEGVADVEAQKLNPYTLSGIVPSSHQPGDVPVRVLTAAGQCLGMTCFRYIDEMREMVRQMVKDPTLQSLWFAMWSQEHGFFGADIDISQVLGPVNMPNQDSSSQTKQQQSVKILQLLVYTAAETDARQFIDMIFSTSAGKIIFNSYKDKTPLPEDIARANGHEDLARYLQDLNIRLSKEADIEAQSKAIDWSELVKAVQTQASVSEEELSSQQKCPSESDDKSSDFFADAEISSCGSFDLDEANQSDSKDKESGDEGFFAKDAASKEEPNKRPATSMNEPLKEIPDKKEKPSDNKGPPRLWHSFSVFGWFSKWQKSNSTSPMSPGISLNTKDVTESSTIRRFPGVTFTPGFSLFEKGSTSGQANRHTTGKPRTAKPKECGHNNHKRSPKRAAAGWKYKGFLLAFVMVTMLAGLKLGEGYVLHWAVGNGYTRISKLLLHCGVYMDAPGLFEETPLHLAAKHGFKDLVDILVQNGGNVNARNFPSQETPLHLAARNGHQDIAEFLIKHGSEVNVRNAPQENTPLHLAIQYGQSQVAVSLIQHGSDVNATNAQEKGNPFYWLAPYSHGRNVFRDETPLHLASRNGLKQVVDILLQHGSDANARNAPMQESPLHLAARNGHHHVVESLIQRGSRINARNILFKETPLHLAARNGHQHVVESLVQHGSQINARTELWQETPLHLAAQNGHQHVVESLVQHGGQIIGRNDLWQQTSLHLALQNGHKEVNNSLLQHRSEISENLDLMVEKGHTVIENDHSTNTCVSTTQKECKTMLPLDALSPYRINVYNCTGGILALNLCHTVVLVSSKRNRFETQTRKEKEAEKQSTEGGHVQMIALPCRSKTVDIMFVIEVYHRTQRSADQGNANYYLNQIYNMYQNQNYFGVNGLYDEHACKVWSSHQLKVKNDTSRLLMGDVLFPIVSPSSDQYQQHRIVNSIDQYQQQSRVDTSDQSHEDSTLNSSDHYKQTRIKTGKLVRVAGAILTVSLVVACLLWYQYQFRVVITNERIEPNVVPSPEPLLECPGKESLNIVVDSAHTPKKAKDYLQDLSFVDTKELRLERVRFWLNRDLDPGVVPSSKFRQEMIMSPALEIKAGVPSGQELYNLSVEVGVTWKKLGYALQIPNAVLESIDEDECKTSEKCFNLLLSWKQRSGKLATYTALEAGLHAVERSDLAKMFCYSSGSVKLLNVCEG